MAAYDLYGFTSDNLQAVRSMLESSLSIRFDERESEYHEGEYFQWGKNQNEHFVLKRNIDPYDREPSETTFPTHQILFYVNDTVRSQDLQEQLSKGAKDFILLRHEDLD